MRQEVERFRREISQETVRFSFGKDGTGAELVPNQAIQDWLTPSCPRSSDGLPEVPWADLSGQVAPLPNSRKK